MIDEIQMTVSPVCFKDGKNFAFVQFSGEGKQAEGKIPDCTIMSNDGFSEAEVKQLQDYMKSKLTELKKMAAGINLLDAFMEKS